MSSVGLWMKQEQFSANNRKTLEKWQPWKEGAILGELQGTRANIQPLTVLYEVKGLVKD